MKDSYNFTKLSLEEIEKMISVKHELLAALTEKYGRNSNEVKKIEKEIYALEDEMLDKLNNGRNNSLGGKRRKSRGKSRKRPKSRKR